ncbi:MAG: TIGR02281 family clan AA aspartic protease [Hyphomicrobiaceae bacterium]|nr:TIGR02281 family clan AA aspartic protease [Hyphomicrobiaceae bacterium]
MLWILLTLIAPIVIAAVTVKDSAIFDSFEVSVDAVFIAFALIVLLSYTGSLLLIYYNVLSTRVARNLTAWVCISFSVIIIYIFREEAYFVPDKVVSEILTSDQALRITDNIYDRKSVRIRKRNDGHYVARGRINNKVVSMFVDTGASTVMLTSNDAKIIGLNPSDLRYNVVIKTANSTAYAATVHLDRIEIGSITIYNVKALVAKPGSLSKSLLGMSFLRRLKSFEFSQRFLVMRT